MSDIDLGPMPCKWCNSPTARATLNHYGARCFRCYEAYVLEPQPSPDVGDRRKDSKSWAEALRKRENLLEHLNQSQRDMGRQALRVSLTPESEEQA